MGLPPAIRSGTLWARFGYETGTSGTPSQLVKWSLPATDYVHLQGIHSRVAITCAPSRARQCPRLAVCPTLLVLSFGGTSVGHVRIQDVVPHVHYPLSACALLVSIETCMIAGLGSSGPLDEHLNSPSSPRRRASFG